MVIFHSGFASSAGVKSKSGETTTVTFGAKGAATVTQTSPSGTSKTTSYSGGGGSGNYNVSNEGGGTSVTVNETAPSSVSTQAITTPTNVDTSNLNAAQIITQARQQGWTNEQLYQNILNTNKSAAQTEAIVNAESKLGYIKVNQPSSSPTMTQQVISSVTGLNQQGNFTPMPTQTTQTIQKSIGSNMGILPSAKAASFESMYPTGGYGYTPLALNNLIATAPKTATQIGMDINTGKILFTPMPTQKYVAPERKSWAELTAENQANLFANAGSSYTGISNPIKSEWVNGNIFKGTSGHYALTELTPVEMLKGTGSTEQRGKNELLGTDIGAKYTAETYQSNLLSKQYQMEKAGIFDIMYAQKQQTAKAQIATAKKDILIQVKNEYNNPNMPASKMSDEELTSYANDLFGAKQEKINQSLKNFTDEYNAQITAETKNPKFIATFSNKAELNANKQFENFQQSPEYKNLQIATRTKGEVWTQDIVIHVAKSAGFKTEYPVTYEQFKANRPFSDITSEEKLQEEYSFKKAAYELPFTGSWENIIKPMGIGAAITTTTIGVNALEGAEIGGPVGAVIGAATGGAQAALKYGGIALGAIYITETGTRYLIASPEEKGIIKAEALWQISSFELGSKGAEVGIKTATDLSVKAYDKYQEFKETNKIKNMKPIEFNIQANTISEEEIGFFVQNKGIKESISNVRYTIGGTNPNMPKGQQNFLYTADATIGSGVIGKGANYALQGEGTYVLKEINLAPTNVENVKGINYNENLPMSLTPIKTMEGGILFSGSAIVEGARVNTITDITSTMRSIPREYQQDMLPDFSKNNEIIDQKYPEIKSDIIAKTKGISENVVKTDLIYEETTSNPFEKISVSKMSTKTIQNTFGRGITKVTTSEGDIAMLGEAGKGYFDKTEKFVTEVNPEGKYGTYRGKIETEYPLKKSTNEPQLGIEYKPTLKNKIINIFNRSTDINQANLMKSQSSKTLIGNKESIAITRMRFNDLTKKAYGIFWKGTYRGVAEGGNLNEFISTKLLRLNAHIAKGQTFKENLANPKEEGFNKFWNENESGETTSKGSKTITPSNIEVTAENLKLFSKEKTATIPKEESMRISSKDMEALKSVNINKEDLGKNFAEQIKTIETEKATTKIKEETKIKQESSAKVNEVISTATTSKTMPVLSLKAPTIMKTNLNFELKNPDITKSINNMNIVSIPIQSISQITKTNTQQLLKQNVQKVTPNLPNLKIPSIMITPNIIPPDIIITTGGGGGFSIPDASNLLGKGGSLNKGANRLSGYSPTLFGVEFKIKSKGKNSFFSGLELVR